MALIEIDGLPNLIAWWIFPWRTDHGFQFAMLVITRWYQAFQDGNLLCEAIRNKTGIIQQKGDTLCSYHIL